MVRVLTWLSNEHDWRLIAVAVLVCVLASVAAVNLFQHARETIGRSRWTWLGTAGLAAGIGIWSAHLIAMLAYEPAIAVGLHVGLTATSLAAAVGVTAAGLAVATQMRPPWNIPVGGAILGAGIVVMHDIGIAGLDIPGRVVWSMDLVAASVVIAVVFGMAAVVAATRREARPNLMLASVLLATGVLAHHVVAMGAIAVLSGPRLAAADQAFSPTVLAVVIAGVAVAVLGMALVALTADRRLRRLYRRHNHRLDAALNNMSQGLCMFDASARLAVRNHRYLEMYNLLPEVVKPGCTLYDLLVHRIARGTFSGDPGAYIEKLLASFAEGKSFTTTTEVGDGRVIAVVNSPMAGGGWVATHEDITDRRRAEQQLDETRRFLNSIFEHVPATVVVKDAKTRRYILINRAAEKFYGLSADQVIGKTVYDFFPQDAADAINARDEALLEGGQPLLYSDHPIITPSGEQRLVTTQRVIIPGADGKPQYLLGVVEDVTERKRAEARIEHMAHHDALTGLPNRVLFNRRLDEALERVKRQDESVAILCLDLDQFKSVNDTLGHPVGDKLLKAVATRIAHCLPERGLVARLGGDEFAIIQGSIASPDDASRLAARLIEVVSETYQLGEHEVVVGASVGIALAPEDGEASDVLLRAADMALYRAKSDGRGMFHFFEPEMDRRIQARRSLELDLRKAYQNGEFELYYQPLMNLQRDEVSGFEALLRWPHPERGMIQPGDFIPLAEEIGLIVPIGEWVLRRACEDAATWPANIKVAVNLSPVQFRNRGLVQAVVSALAHSGLAANRLELEITESVLLGDTEANIATLHSLRALGASISMDDFGTGYSSLSYLRSFPFDKIKIDRSFVNEMMERADCVAIIRAVAGLGMSLGIATTAEGVETSDQLDRLRAEGCTEIQGYLVSPPRPASEVWRLLAESNPRAASAA
jgi:diguanylate cyclase (GGDEF)-like protein/PAS domain S-box-containing protein